MDDIIIKLDCEPDNQLAVFRHRGALLAAIKLNSDYSAAKDWLIGTGPELFAEHWIGDFIHDSDRNFEDLILVYFTKILQGVQHAK